ncbi:MAG: LLM class flavin-dependent oxidoreductase [Gemmatimonadota bacterium]|nr:LLM class flavin-dependent oxidoreductase [Gemmatimonadota bacterium]
MTASLNVGSDVPSKPPIRLSVLDQSPVPEGQTGAEALRNSIDLARFADQLGYHRYWVAEHHGGPMLAGPSPEALIGPIAALTTRIRVGSGGVMLPHYSPLKVAETFSVLSGLFPGRIDLGIGRASGTDAVTTFALQRDRRERSPDDFPQQLGELLAYLHDRLPADHPFARLGALPGLPESPELWLLGSSPQSAIWAGELALPYVVADFINPAGVQLAAIYRERFVPNEYLAEPRVIVAMSSICAESDDEARRLSSSAKMAMIFLRSGNLIAVPTVEKALRFLAARGSSPDAMPPGRRAVVGSPATVHAGIERIAAEYGAEEVMIVSIIHDHDARRRSYELIAGEFGLSVARAPSERSAVLTGRG